MKEELKKKNFTFGLYKACRGKNRQREKKNFRKFIHKRQIAKEKEIQGEEANFVAKNSTIINSEIIEGINSYIYLFT